MQISSMSPFRQGLVFGFGLTLIEMTIYLINAFTSDPTASNIGLALVLSIIGFLIGLAGYFVAGMSGAKGTGKVGTGSIVGLVAGSTYGIIGLIISLSVFFSITLPTVQRTSGLPTGFAEGFVIGGVGFAIFGVLMAAGLGAGLGALGGLAGKNMYKPGLAPESMMPPVGLGYPQPMMNPYQAGQYPPQQQPPYTEYPNQNPYTQNPYNQNPY